MSSTQDKVGSIADRLAAPVCLAALFATTALWAGAQLSHTSGGFSAGVYAPFANRQELETAWPRDKTTSQLFKQGRYINEKNCQVCHQPNGLGTSEQFPPLTASEWVVANSPSRIIRVVLNGLQGPIEISNQQFGTLQMPPWRDVLSDEEIAAVLTFIRGNTEWGNKAPPVKAAQVKAIRDKTQGRVGSWTYDELMSVGDKD